MRRHRESSLRRRTATRTTRWTWKAVQALCVIWLALITASCVAQRADLVKMEEEFEGKISKLDREKRALAQTLEQAKRNIAASTTLLKEQKNELDKFRRDSARINLDWRRQYEESQSDVTNELEEQSHRLDQIDRKLADDAVRNEQLERGAAEQSARVDALRKNIEQDLAQRNEQVNAQFAEFQESLVEFKQILGRVDKRLGQERDRATSSETTMQQEFMKQQGNFQAKLDEDTQTLKTYVETSVKTTIDAINGALKKITDRQDADGKAQAAELSKLNKELAKMDTALQQAERTVSANVTQMQAQGKTQAEDVEKLRQAVVQMRGVLDSMGKLLGERGDEQMKQVGQTMARLGRLEQAQSSETAKQSENIQAISTHLREVTASVESVVQSFEEFKTAFTERLNEQAEIMASSAKASDVQRLQQELEANVKHWNTLSRSVAKLKKASNDLVTKLGSKIDEHESQIVELRKSLSQSRPSAPKPMSP